jgi:hypothetical protein
MSNGISMQIENHGQVILCAVLSYIWVNMVFRVLIIHYMSFEFQNFLYYSFQSFMAE